MNAETINIAACTDKWFVMPTGVMMQSVCMNNPDAGVVFHIIIDDDVSADDQRDLSDIAVPFKNKSVVFYPINHSLQEISFPALGNRHNLTKASFFRLYLADYLPDTIEKVLYLDGDTIVRHSLLPLWGTDLTNYAVGVVCDAEGSNIEYYNRLRYSPNLGYFNSGVMLINLKYWREHHIQEEFSEFIHDYYEAIRFHDQDVLNYVFRERKKQLPVKYNLQHSYLWKKPSYYYWELEKEVLEAREDPVIIHFTAALKPWDKCQLDFHPFRSSFYKYQNQTKWKGVRVERRSLKLRVINFVASTLRKWKILSAKYEYIDIAPLD